MNFLKTNFQFCVLATLILMGFFYMNKDKAPVAAPTIVVVSDTTDKNHEGTVITQPTLVQSIPYPVDRIPADYVPASTIDSVVAQYKRLLAEHFVTNVQKDTLKVDSLGYVSATTYTSKNKVDSLRYDYRIKERIINNTITITQPAKATRKVLLGGGINANLGYQITGGKVGVMYQNRKDQLFGLGGEYNVVGGLSIEAQTFVPIRLRKKK